MHEGLCPVGLMVFKKIFKIDDKDYINNLGRASMMGIHLVSGTVVGLVIGIYLDKWLGIKPWMTLIFLLFGIAAGFKNMLWEFRKIQKQGTPRDDNKDQSLH